jgi:hypothetical protein
MSTSSPASGLSAARMSAGSMVGKVALHVDDDIDVVFGIDRLERFVDTIRTGDVIAARHHRAAAGFFHRRGDSFRIGGHDHLADGRGVSTSKHMHDHRHAIDLGQRFAGQARGGKACGNEDDGVWHWNCRENRPHDGCR